MRTMLKGMLVGIANSIPGVSGGTILVLTNLFEKSIESIKNPWKERLFLMKLGLGIVSGLLLFSNLISFGLAHYKIPTFYLFVGLVLGGTIRFVQKELKEKSYVYIIFGLLLVVLLDKMMWFSGEHFLLLLLGGMLAGAATIMPGISGSLLLLILNQYEAVIGFVKEFSRLDFTHWMDLLYFALGGTLGLYSMSLLLSFLLKKHRKQLMNFVLGLLLGSILILIPMQSYTRLDLWLFVTLPVGLWLGLYIK